MQVEAIIPASVERPGAFTVEAHMLFDLVKSAEKGAQIWLKHDDNRVRLSHGRTSQTLPTLPRDDFPILRTVDDDAARFTLCPSWQRDLAALAPVMSKGETRYYLNGIAMQYNHGRYVMVSRDNENLAPRWLAAIPLREWTAS